MTQKDYDMIVMVLKEFKEYKGKDPQRMLADIVEALAQLYFASPYKRFVDIFNGK